MSDEPTDLELELGEDASFYIPETQAEKRRMWSLCFASTVTKDPAKIFVVAERINGFLSKGGVEVLRLVKKK